VLSSIIDREDEADDPGSRAGIRMDITMKKSNSHAKTKRGLR
jgi:hypothetical protein